MPQDVDLCGSYTIPAPPKFPDAISQNLATAIYAAHQAAFNNALPKSCRGARKWQNCCIGDLQEAANAGSNGNMPLSQTPIGTIIDDYQRDLVVGIIGAV